MTFSLNTIILEPLSKEKPKNASYEYIILPNVNKQELKSYNNNNISVIENSKRIQAVKHNTLNTIQIIFYQASTLNYQNFRISVDKPCILMLSKINEFNNEKTELYISDLSYNEKYINIEIENKKENIQKNIKVELPLNEYKGSTSKHILSKKYDVSINKNPFVYFSSSKIEVSENNSNINIRLNLNKEQSEDIFVELDISGSAINKLDYTLSSRKIKIAKFTKSSDFILNIKDDNLYEKDENIFVKIKNVKKGGIGINNTFLITIKDNDPPYQLLLEPIDDTYIKGGVYSSKNYGQDNTITVRRGRNQYLNYGFLKFDLSNIKNIDIESIKLRIKMYWSNVDISNAKWRFFSTIKNNWDENVINFNNPPNKSDVIGNVIPKARGLYTYLDITDFVRQKISNNIQELSIKIESVGKNDGYAMFYSKENKDENIRPKLIILGNKKEINKKSHEFLSKVYPNPVVKDLNLLFKPNFLTENTLKGITLQLVDIQTGKVYIITNYNKIDKDTITIDMSTYKNSSYILKIKSDILEDSIHIYKSVLNNRGFLHKEKP